MQLSQGSCVVYSGNRTFKEVRATFPSGRCSCLYRDRAPLTSYFRNRTFYNCPDHTHVRQMQLSQGLCAFYSRNHTFIVVPCHTPVPQMVCLQLMKSYGESFKICGGRPTQDPNRGSMIHLLKSVCFSSGYLLPAFQPSSFPAFHPLALQPSSPPVLQPSSRPALQPCRFPAFEPSSPPTLQPYNLPAFQFSSSPSCQPSAFPALQLSSLPAFQPSSLPALQPSSLPALHPCRFPAFQLRDPGAGGFQG